MENKIKLQSGDVWDALVLGAGPAGAMTALQLASAGWRILIVEKAVFPREKVCGGFLGPENKKLLQRTGVWQKLARPPVTFLEQMWLTSPGGVSVRMPFPEGGGPGLAVCRKDLDAAIVERAVEEGAVFASPAYAEKKSPGVYDIYSPNLKERVQVFARHVIDARGSASLESVPAMGFGMSAYFAGVRWMKNRVVLHFANDGHFGLDPVREDCVTGCFVASRDMIDRAGKDPEKIFRDFCGQNRFLAAQMKNAKRLSAWQGIPVKLSRKPVFFDDGIYRVGDAVATVDPVVGGGMTLALQGAILLAESLVRYSPQRVNEAQAVQLYACKWKKAFGWKLPVSHFWGMVGHRAVLTDGLLRVLKTQKDLLKYLFEWHHTALPAVLKWEGAL